MVHHYPYNVDSGAEYFGTKGKMFISKRGKFEVRGERNEPLDVKLDWRPESEVSENQQNWIDCIKSGGVPNANMEIAVRTATAVHSGQHRHTARPNDPLRSDHRANRRRRRSDGDCWFANTATAATGAIPAGV